MVRVFFVSIHVDKPSDMTPQRSVCCCPPAIIFAMVVVSTQENTSSAKKLLKPNKYSRLSMLEDLFKRRQRPSQQTIIRLTNFFLPVRCTHRPYHFYSCMHSTLQLVYGSISCASSLEFGYLTIQIGSLVWAHPSRLRLDHS